jgi:nitrogen fixation protein FixH
MTAATGEEARRSRWIPWAFVGFFGVVLVVNGVMVFVAFSTWTGLEAESAYKQGLAYNRALERARVQDALGWRVALSFEPSQRGERGLLSLDLEDARGGFIEQAVVHARLARPTHEGYDFVVRVPHHWGGTYQTEITFPLPGVWNVELAVEAPEGRYQLNDRIFLAP